MLAMTIPVRMSAKPHDTISETTSQPICRPLKVLTLEDAALVDRSLVRNIVRTYRAAIAPSNSPDSDTG